MHKSVVPLINELNVRLTKHLLDKTSEKKVVLDLSGGHDTRVNLSILLKNHVKFDCYTKLHSIGDIEISKKITKQYGLYHYVNPKRDDTKEQEFKSDYDISISGSGYTETLNACNSMFLSLDKLEERVILRENVGQSYTPAIEKDVIEIVRKIPIVYLMGGVMQKELIKLNEPSLLDFPFTFYDMRHQIMNIFYPRIADIIFNSYFKGKGRNYSFVDVKSKRGKTWDD